VRLDDFDGFFAAVNDGHAPFGWQRRLCDHVAQEGRWPDQIVAPTGTGKSNVVDVHVFLNALQAAGAGPRVPRRLAVVVNRRALVDQHWERANVIRAKLEADGGVLAEIATLLRGLCGRYDVHNDAGESAEQASPLLVTSLRGGARPDAEWIDDPRACAVIAATPDMWGSRVLFRGYGTTRHARPREAGLLAVDSVMVLDESHPNLQLLVTARDVATATAQECRRLGVPPLNVVATTATPTQVGEDHVGVTQQDVADDELLRQRLLTRKPLRLHPTGQWPTGAKPSEAYVKELANLAERLSDEVTNSDSAARTVGCVVNNVDTAVRLTEALQKRRPREGAVVAWVGRLRPMDLEQRRTQHPGLFTVGGDADVDFLVATQTVEVGVDIDLAAMLTELAPGAAVAQRAGRVDRLGVRGSGPVVVVTPSDVVAKDRLPYRAAELESSWQWLRHREATGEGLAPWTLTENPPPVERPSRHAFTHLYPGDWWVLAETNVDQFAEVDLDFWLRDDLEAETEPVGIVVRWPLPVDTAAAIELLRVCPVVADEIFPAVLRAARGLVERILVSEPATARVFLDRAGTLSMLAQQGDVRPGDTLIVDACHSLTRQGVVTDEPPKQTEHHRTLWADVAEQTLGDEPALHGNVVVGGNTSRQGDELLSLAADEDPAELSTLVTKALGRRVDVVVYPEAREPGEEPVWMAIRPTDDIVLDPEVRQEMTPSPEPVHLATHQSNVARLARRMGAELGLHPEIVTALDFAGQHHDDGKADTRFQRSLGAREDVPMAKSARRSWFERRRARERSSLPQGWRHEQLSVALASAHGDDVSDLALRLIGTSHGRGRPFFPHGPSGLIGQDYNGDLPAVRRIFEAASGWSDILEATHELYGPCGCAYLEAVLRSADSSVSRDGS